MILRYFKVPPIYVIFLKKIFFYFLLKNEVTQVTFGYNMQKTYKKVLPEVLPESFFFR